MSHISLRLFPVLTLLSSLIFFSSCAGSVKIVGRGCQTFDGQFMDINKEFNPDKVWQKKVWTSGGPESSARTFTIEEVLLEKEIECRRVSRLRYKIGQSFWDQVFSIVPFVQRMTITVEVETKANTSTKS